MAKNVMEEIYAKYDLKNDEDVLALYRALQSGEYILDSPEGKRLDDEIYDRAMEIKQQRARKVVEQKTEELSDRRNGQKKEKSKKVTQKKTKQKVIVLTKGEYFVRKLVSICLIFAAVGCLGYFGLYCYEAYVTRQEQEHLAHLKENDAVNDMFSNQVILKKDKDTGAQVKVTILDEYKSLYNKNKNLIGWLKIADTNIDYPVMQSGDNEFYLNHNIDLKEDKNGSLFLDASCDVLKPSTNFIIYGHNMRSGNMFGSLSKYKEASYYQKHPYISFDTIYEKGEYQIVFAFRSHIYAEDEITFKYYQFIDATTEKEFDSNMKAMKELSIYDTGIMPEYGDQLITLSTCDYDQADGRFVVVAKRIQ